jgi:hypothetical protein
MSEAAADLEQKYPWIPWRSPVLMLTPKRNGYACRLCIGRLGFRACDAEACPFLFETMAECERHIAECHP